MRSADPRILLVALAVLGPALAGCDSTFQQNARAELAASRRLIAEKPHTVAERGRDVRVDAVTLLRDRASTAVVVDVHSTVDHIVTDVRSRSACGAARARSC